MFEGRVDVLPEDLAVLAPGPSLGFLLGDLDRSALDDGDLVRVAQARQRLISHLQAQLFADLHVIGQRSDDAVGRENDPSRGRWAEVEIAWAMTWTHRAAACQLDLADDLCDRLPAVFAALDAGDIDVPKAKVFADATSGLDALDARHVADQVLDQAGRWTTGQLRARLQRLVLAVDPEAAARRAKQAVTERRVQARLTDVGVGELCGYDLPPHRVAAAMERLTAIARAAKNDGDTRRIDQLRADVFLALLVGDGFAADGSITDVTDAPVEHVEPLKSPEPADPASGVEGDDAVDPDRLDRLRGAMPAPRKGVIDLQVPLTTLMGLTDHPAELGGWGPVLADIARQVVAQQADATWRFSVYDELGELAAHGITRRRPTAQDAAFVKARDRTCRAPGCRMPARICDIDHTDDWASSKDSRRRNLANLCRRHHDFKHLAGCDLTQITPGVLGWTTPLGQRYVTRPDTLPDG